MAADPSRLVDVRGVHPPDADGVVYEEWGSGLLVTDDLVLTAAHVVFDGSTPLEVSLSCQQGAHPATGQVVWPLPRGEVDAALVRVNGRLPRSLGRPLRWGRFTGREAEQHVDATGFPTVMVDGSRRVGYQVKGHVNPQGALQEGRYLVSVDEPPADPGPETPSPWEGMSGSVLMSGETVVGVVVIDTPGFPRDLLTAVPASAVASSPSARVLLGLTGPLLSVELSSLLARPAVARGRLSPAQLLRADEEVIPFHGRDEELRDLLAWCTSDADFGAWLITGPGGRGKTRLAQALVEKLEETDGAWVSGMLSSRSSSTEDLSVVMSTMRVHPVLLVADYAESRGDQLDALLRSFEDAGNPPRFRLLLLARSGGEWWDRLRDRRVCLDEARFLSLPQLHPLWDRAAAFSASVETFVARLAEIHPAVDWNDVADRIGDVELNDERLGDPLALQLTALLALLGSAGEQDPHEAPELRLIRHEREYWRSTLAAEGLQLPPSLRDQAVATATLFSARNRAAAVALLERVPALTNHLPVAEWLRSLYPTETGTRFWGPLQPDRLGEHHIGAVTREEPTLLEHLLGSEDVGELQEAMVIIGRAMAHQPHLGDQVAELLARGETPLLEAAKDAAERVANPLPLLRVLPPDVASRHYTLDPDDYGSVSSWGHDTNVPERLSEIGRGMGGTAYTSTTSPHHPPNPPHWEGGPPAPEDANTFLSRGLDHERMATQAYERGELRLAAHEYAEAVSIFRNPFVPQDHLPRALLAHAAVLNDLRSFDRAAMAVDEGVSILRGGTVVPEVLGRALDLQAGIMAEMGQLERALSFGYDAVRLLGGLGARRGAPPVARRDYAKSLSNLAGLLQRVGRASEAFERSGEALEIFRELHGDGALAPGDATYGRVVLGHARIQATALGPDGALALVRQAIAEFERIGGASDSDRQATSPELASAHGLSCVLHEQLGDLPSALSSGLLAVREYTRLAERTPGFTPDLARSLAQLANLRLKVGQAALAVEAAQQAVELLESLGNTTNRPGVSAPASLTRDRKRAATTLGRARAMVWNTETNGGSSVPSPPTSR